MRRLCGGNVHRSIYMQNRGHTRQVRGKRGRGYTLDRYMEKEEGTHWTGSWKKKKRVHTRQVHGRRTRYTLVRYIEKEKRTGYTLDW